jgi:hypothetical protein
MGKVEQHFVEIKYTREKTVVLYRFFGRGEWKVKDGRRWRDVNGIYVPGDVLSAAAAYCRPTPPPMLTEIEIARLCGGRNAKAPSHGR